MSWPHLKSGQAQAALLGKAQKVQLESIQKPSNRNFYICRNVLVHLLYK